MSAERAGPGAGGGPRSPVPTADCAPQLQDAFSRGLLKPGLNVVLEGPKKAVNDVVSSGAGSGGPGTRDALQALLGSSGRGLVPGKTRPARCRAGQFPSRVLHAASVSAFPRVA